MVKRLVRGTKRLNNDFGHTWYIYQKYGIFSDAIWDGYVYVICTYSDIDIGRILMKTYIY